MRAYPGKSSHKTILPLLACRAEVGRRRAERGEGRGEESNSIASELNGGRIWMLLNCLHS
jgi:hypothetical protein